MTGAVHRRMQRQGLALAACPGLGPRRAPTCRVTWPRRHAVRTRCLTRVSKPVHRRMHRQGLALAACPGLGPRRTPTCCSDSAALPCCAYSVHTARIKNGDRQRVPVPGTSCPCRGKACQKPAFLVSLSTGICTGRDWHLLPVPVWDRGGGNHVEVTWPRCQVERTRCKACIKNGDRQRVPVPGASRQCRGKACQKPPFWFLRPPAYAAAGTGTCCLSRFGTAAKAIMLK